MSAGPAVPHRRFPWLRYFFGFVLIGVLSLLPFFISIIASDYAVGQGCRVDEASIHPCLINGQDYGVMFYNLGMTGWLGLLTVPLGLVVGGILLVIMLLHLVLRSRRPQVRQ